VEIDPRDEALLEGIGRLRVAAVADEGLVLPGVADGSSLDDHECHARHWAVLDSYGNPVAAARLCVHQQFADLPQQPFYAGLDFDPTGPIAALTRLVVLPAFRGRGLALALDEVRAPRLPCTRRPNCGRCGPRS